MAAKKDLPADAGGRPEPLPNLGSRLATSHERRFLGGQEASGDQEDN
jgi:hypothetical protein